jgi:two-component system CheB/CheR fusion protein
MEATLLDLVDRLPVLVRQSDGKILHWTRGCSELFGYSAQEALGRQAADLLGTTFPEPLKSIEDCLARDGDWKGRLQHKTRHGVVWTEAVWKIKRDSSGAAIVVEQHTDITARIELEERAALLARELEHRVSNIISVVQAIARRTLPDAPAEQRQKLDDRLMALAGANRLLHASSWREAGLRQIWEKVAEGLGVSERVHVAGPDISVTPPHAMGLALALHELSTNALKYGALRENTGYVELCWGIDDGAVRIVWQEREGPPVQAPEKTGFGTTLITNAIPGGTSRVEMRYEPAGVICEFRLPREAVGE